MGEPSEVDTMRPRFKDHHAKEGEAETRRRQSCRAKAPRCAVLLDQVDLALADGLRTIELEMASVFLDARLFYRPVVQEITPAHEARIRAMLAVVGR
jgi:hypothetical protein